MFELKKFNHNKDSQFEPKSIYFSLVNKIRKKVDWSCKIFIIKNE